MEKTPPQTIVLESVRIELRADGQLRIWPNKKLPGSPVLVDAKRLDRWAAKVYRDGVLR